MCKVQHFKHYKHLKEQNKNNLPSNYISYQIKPHGSKEMSMFIVKGVTLLTNNSEVHYN